MERANDFEPDVAREAARVKSDEFRGLLRVVNIRKEYNQLQTKTCCNKKLNKTQTEQDSETIMRNGKIVAVKNASFGLDQGECLALLGVNGAGKTTCFKVLTNEVAQSSG